MIRAGPNQRPVATPMLFSSMRTLVKVLVASLIVGTILSHFSVTSDMLLREARHPAGSGDGSGRRAWDWAAPNVLLGAMIIVPVWFVIFIFRPPGASSD